MLKNHIRSEAERARYMCELKEWLDRERDTPIETMTDFFSRRLNIYEDVHLGRWAEEYAHIADYFDEGLHTLLDIGCGTGLELEAIYRRFPRVQVTGIDLSADMLARLEEKYAGRDINIELITADYFKYPFRPASYDAAMSFETLHHFEYGKKQKIYDKLFEALRPGGYYIECDYIACCEDEEALCLNQYVYKRQKEHVPEDVFVHLDIPLTLEHQKELKERAGFKNIRVLYENDGTMVIRAEKAGRENECFKS